MVKKGVRTAKYAYIHFFIRADYHAGRAFL